MKLLKFLFIIVTVAVGCVAPVGADERQVIVYLKDQPFVAVARDLHSRAAPSVAALENKARGAPGEASNAASRVARSEIQSLLSETNRRILKLCADATAADQQAVGLGVAALGGRVKYRYSTVNALSISAPSEVLSEIEKLPQVARVVPDRSLSPLLNISIPSLLAPVFWNSGFTGGDWRAAVLDTGVLAGHPGLIHDWTSGVFHETAVTDPDYADDQYSTSDLHGHGTRVAGPIGSMNPTYLGVSYGTTRMLNLKAGYRLSNGGGLMQDSDMMAAIDWAVSDSGFPPNVLNFSYAGDRGLEDSELTRYWDSIVGSLGISASIAAGNTSGSQNVHEPAIGYNVISVGAVYTMGTTDRSDDFLAYYSSWGPTVGGRKKPDLVAPGSTSPEAGIMLPALSGGYGWGNGTSYAAPHIAGCLVLLGDMGIANPMSQKAILLTTAEDKGDPGWDQKYGWGYVDLASAYACAAEENHARDSVEPAGGDSVRYYGLNAAAGGKATLVWNRHADYEPTGYPNTSHPLNDLDLHLYRESSNDLLSASESRIDNVEQVVTPTPLGDGVVKVSAYSTYFAEVDREEFAVAANSALSPVEGAALALELPYVSIVPGGSAAVTVKAYNTGGLAAHGVQVTLFAPGLSISGANPVEIGVMAAGAEAEASWFVGAAVSGVYPSACVVQSESYDEILSTSQEFNIYAGAPLGAIRLMQDGLTVAVIGKIVTATIAGETYVQEPDRSSAIKLTGAAGAFAPGDVIEGEGTLRTDCGGRVVFTTSAAKVGDSSEPEPVLLLSRDAGGGPLGGYVPAVLGGLGANNLGLLVRLAGRVTESSPEDFYVDDDCGLGGVDGPRGIRVISFGLVSPAIGEFLVVTGISSAYNVSGECVRALLIRTPQDVITLSQ